jgi:outer membrane protein assembly factor BamB
MTPREESRGRWLDAQGRLRATAAGLGLLVAAGWAAALADDWPRWRGPRADGTWRRGRITESFPATGLPRLWRQPIGPGYSGLAVAAGRVYTMDRPAAPADRERIVCLDAATGQPVWEHVYEARYGKLDYGKGPRGAPTVLDGRVYTLGAVGHLLCLDARAGRVLWSHDLAAESGAKLPTWGFAAAPLVAGDLVIVHAALEPRGCFAAFDRRTGAEVWRSGGDPAGYATPILIRHAGEEILVGWTPEHVVALRPQTGEELWRVPYKVTYGVSIATPLFREGLVLVAGYWEGSKAIRLGRSASDAALAWEENRYLRGLMSQPLYRDGHAYLLDKQHGLVCFELRTGKMLWTDGNRLTPRNRNPQASLVWLGETDRAVALNASGELVLAELTPRGYRELGRAPVVGETWAHPAFAGEHVFARDDTQVVCVRVP